MQVTLSYNLVALSVVQAFGSADVEEFSYLAIGVAVGANMLTTMTTYAFG